MVSIREKQRRDPQPLRGIHEVLASGHHGAKPGVHQEIEHVVAIGPGSETTVVFVKAFGAGFLRAWVNGLRKIAAAFGRVWSIEILKLNRSAKLRAEVVA